MHILSAQQIRAWDEYTIQHEPVASIDLMERAASACFNWLMKHGFRHSRFAIFCGKGNNGGDGLAIARLLAETDHDVTVYILEFGHKGTDDFQVNLARIHEMPVELRFIPAKENIPGLEEDIVIIDALLGSGLNRPIEGLTAQLVDHLNNLSNKIIAIDISSGLSADNSSKDHQAIEASYTLSFQCLKKAFLVAENEKYTGQVFILDIGLHPEFVKETELTQHLVTETLANSIYRPRKAFSHKGNYGHALLIAGSYGKMGAAVLSANACLHAGVGLLTLHTPACGYTILQTAVPEAMCLVDDDKKAHTKPVEDISKYSVIGIGPGIGTEEQTTQFLRTILSGYKKPLVIDADALNIISENKDLFSVVPAYSVITPHPREFERLFGSTDNDFQKIDMALQKARELKIIVVLKGRYTCIATPSGQLYFNTSGNPGMATGGTGDALTGILTALIGQGYTTEHAAILGVYLHGLAGDMAVENSSQEYMSAGDLISHLGVAFRAVSNEQSDSSIE